MSVPVHILLLNCGASELLRNFLDPCSNTGFRFLLSLFLVLSKQVATINNMNYYVPHRECQYVMYNKENISRI